MDTEVYNCMKDDKEKYCNKVFENSSGRFLWILYLCSNNQTTLQIQLKC